MGEEREKLERESESDDVCGRGGVAMDTPKRNQIATPVSKFEDSPVFNYINSLSPIQPVKSLHITQTFNSLSFASLPSVFTSPHVSSLKESRFLRRHQFSEPSKPEFSSENGNKVGTKEGITDVAYNSDKQQEIFDPGSSVGEASDEPSYECSKLAVELSRTLRYDCVSPDCNPSISCGIETTCLSELAGTSTSLDPFVQEEISQIDQNTEVAGCDWESLISDAADLITFDSPTDAEPLKGPSQKSHNPGLRFCTSCIDDLPETQAAGAVCLNERYESENPSTQPGEAGDMREIVENQETVACTSLENCMVGEPSEKMDDELASNLQRGTRRRCLVFEMVGARRKHFDDGSTCGSSMLSQSHGNIASNDQHLVSLKPVNDYSPRILPGIGLHLNTLATTSMDHKVVKCEALASGGQLISVPRSSASIVQEPSNKFMAATLSERNMGPAENQVPDVEDASQASGDVVNEEFNQNSPKKKRRRLEHAGESEACKRCNCKKSKCLKLYCECFAAGVYCVEPCSCQECFNKPIHEDTVLATRKLIESRNPLAFAPKVIRSSDSVIEIGDESNKTPASARHKRGCNCKKSGCLKKYCECYQGGVGCSINCRCDGCKNAFGRKDGSALIGTEAELEEEEIDECQKSVVDRALQKTVIQNDSEHNIDSAPPATPLQLCRSSIQLPFSSKSKPPRSTSLAIGSSSGLYPSHRIGKLNPVQPQAKFEKHFQTIREDEIPEMPPILEQNGSPTSGVKSSSPNSKRVSPPHCDIGSSSPGKRSSRKLILRSIPSFPSLTPKH